MSERRYCASEIAKMFHISPDTVRYYDNIGAIEPARGENNYRYFNLPAISDTLSAVVLRKAGVSTKQLKRIAESDEGRCLLSILDEAEQDNQRREAELRMPQILPEP